MIRCSFPITCMCLQAGKCVSFFRRKVSINCTFVCLSYYARANKEPNDMLNRRIFQFFSQIHKKHTNKSTLAFETKSICICNTYNILFIRFFVYTFYQHLANRHTVLLNDYWMTKRNYMGGRTIRSIRICIENSQDFPYFSDRF